MFSILQTRPSDITRRIEEEVQSMCRDRQIAALLARRGDAAPVPDCGCTEALTGRQ